MAKTDEVAKLDKPTANMVELAGRIVAAGFVNPHNMGDPAKFVYVYPSTSANWAELKAIVAAQLVGQTDEPFVGNYVMTMLAAAECGKSVKAHDKLTGYTGEAKTRYSGGPNVLWNGFRTVKRAHPIVVAFDSLSSVPSAGRGGKSRPVVAVDVDTL